MTLMGSYRDMSGYWNECTVINVIVMKDVRWLVGPNVNENGQCQCMVLLPPFQSILYLQCI